MLEKSRILLVFVIAPLVVASVWFASSSALCETRAAAVQDGAKRNLVVILASRQEETNSSLILAAMNSQVVDLEVTVRTQWLDKVDPDLGAQLRLAKEFAPKETTLVVVWFELNLSDKSLLYFFLPQSDKLFVRGFSASSIGSLSEAMAVVVRGSVASLMTSGDDSNFDFWATGPDEETSKGQGRQEDLNELSQPTASPVSEAPSEPPVVEERARKYDVVFLAAYQPELFTARLWSHGLYLGALHRVWGPWSIGLGYDMVLSEIVYVRPELRLSLHRHPVWLGFGGELELSKRWSLGAQIAGVADFVTYELKLRGETEAASADKLSVDAWLCLGLGAMFRIIDEVVVTADLGILAGMKRSSYEARSSQGRVELLSPVLFRPFGRIGIRLNLW